jgi:hypothetical protein
MTSMRCVICAGVKEAQAVRVTAEKNAVGRNNNFDEKLTEITVSRK